MIYVGEEQIVSFMVGEIGVQEALIGSETIYTRSGGYCYIMLETNLTEKEN